MRCQNIITTPAMLRRCSRCKVEKEPNKFQLRQKDSSGGKKGQLTDKCTTCIEKEREYRSQKRKKEDTDAEDGWELPPNAAVSSVDELVARLGSYADPNTSGSFKFGARVDSTVVAPPSMDLRERADAIARVVGDGTLWHWS